MVGNKHPSKRSAPSARHAQLVSTLRAHDHAYYNLDQPTISDREYDRLFEELVRLETEHPELITTHSPTQRVGDAPMQEFAKVTRAHRMFSLDNSYNPDALREFEQRVRDTLKKDGSAQEPLTFVVEPKIDGASLEVIYRDGVLQQASTRGDGVTGEDVTSNVKTIRALPITVEDPRPFTLRGEVFIHRQDLQRVNQERVRNGEAPFANPRNVASGSLRLLDSAITAKRGLRIHLYDLVERHFSSHVHMLHGLADLQLPTHRLHRHCADLEGVFAAIEELENSRLKLPYDIDGAVVKVNEYPHRDVLGATSRAPRWAIAQKFVAERAFTQILSISHDVGRTGAITPVADLLPVSLAGTTVAHASMHNMDYVRDKDIRVGDTVAVQKAGEIIPQVVEVDKAQRPKGAKPWKPPTHCPACGTSLVREEGRAALRCPNPTCPGKLKASVWYFARRSAMDIDHLGKVLVEQLVDSGLVQDLADVFRLTQHRESLLQLERMGDKSVDNLLEAVNSARTGRPFSRLLTGLGIPLVGTVAARQVAEVYGNLGELLDTPRDVLRERLAAIHGFGERMAQSVADHIHSPEFRPALEGLIQVGVQTTAEPSPERSSTGPLDGLALCVTGTLSEPRKNIHSLIESHGGVVHDSIKKDTSHLVVGENVGSRKVSDAKKRGVHVISEAQLRELIGVPPG